MSSNNLISLLQNPPVVFEVPSNLPPGDIRQTVKDTVISYIKAGNYPSTALQLKNDDYPYILYAGYRVIETQEPISKKTIYRIASISKMITSVTVMQYIEKKKISLKDRVSEYLPGFANTSVLKKITPTSYPFTNFSSVQGSTLITIELPSLDPDQINALLNKQTGIQITNNQTGVNVDGIMTIVDVNTELRHVTVLLNGPSQVTSNFTVEATLDVLPPLPPNWSPYDYVLIPSSPVNPFARERAYYSTEPSAPVTVRHLLTHTAGIAYAAPGYSADLQSLRTAIMFKRDPQLVRFSLTPTLDMDAVEWSNRMANIPMLFQPGTDWVYGPQIGIAGAVLMQYERNKGTNRSLYEIQKKSLFDKLEIVDAGYFILDNDPRRQYKIRNLVHSYTNVDTRLLGTPTVVNPFVSVFTNLQDTLLPGLQASLMDGANPPAEGESNPLHPIYGSETPRKLELGDAGLYMTTNDLHKIVRMLLNKGVYNGKRLLKEETVDEMFENQIGPLFINHSIAPTDQKWGYGVAVGDESTGQTALNHVTAFWAGAFGGWWFVNNRSCTAFALNANMLPLVTYQSMVNSIAEATFC